jgi:hypothetical protein
MQSELSVISAQLVLGDVADVRSWSYPHFWTQIGRRVVDGVSISGVGGCYVCLSVCLNVFILLVFLARHSLFLHTRSLSLIIILYLSTQKRIALC